ncbi:HD domain-containing protein [Staphylococcus coagulans]|uniref:HD domain-containing protein n=1 Tax=Staphylococcus coagulans TaxID=74706 RepID=UPI001F4BF0E6|nr:HD domain-containing protein [Staphylococcus coagulans]UNB47344.1 HD domain-containing protein [Staphylococcus coagulans]
MKMKDAITAALNYMKSKHEGDRSGHDVAHVLRVRHLALEIAQHYPLANCFIIEMAALLHDTVDDKLVDSITAHQELEQFLHLHKVPSDDQQAIFYIIDHMSFRKSNSVGTLNTIEAQIVQDADRLDAMGAIGIARTFQFAGHFNEPMWTGEYTLKQLNELEDVSHLPPSAIKHFYEKLLKLKDLMNTQTARQMAEKRHAFLELFLTQFVAEWLSDIHH